MIQARVVRNEIEDQLQPIRVELFPKCVQPSFTAERLRDSISCDGVGRSHDILLRKIGQQFRPNFSQVREPAAESLSEGAGAPNTHEPDMGETELTPTRK